MLRTVGLLCLMATSTLAQQSAKAENRDSSYTSYEPQYQQYSAQVYPAYQGGHSKYDLGTFFSDLSLPTIQDFVTGIVYVMAVASVAGLALLGVFLVLKLLGLKLPIIAELKNKVLAKVDKVDARMIESAWDVLQNAIEAYQKS